jgi:hypothetical protein
LVLGRILHPADNAVVVVNAIDHDVDQCNGERRNVDSAPSTKYRRVDMDQVEVIEAVNAVKSKEVNHHYK